MSAKSAKWAISAAMCLVACSPVPPQYFGPQPASVFSNADATAINAVAFAKRAPPPGQSGYLDTIKYIDDGVKYIDPYAEFFISFDGQMCFRGLVNRRNEQFENYQNYWCIYPTYVNNVDEIENNVSYVNQVRLWCLHQTPQCARRFGYPNFLDESASIGNSISTEIVPYKEQRIAIEYLIYLMGGNVREAAPLRRSATAYATHGHEALAATR